MAVGEQWTLEGDGRVIIYRIESNNSDGKLRIASADAAGESIEAFATGDGLRITRIGMSRGWEASRRARPRVR